MSDGRWVVAAAADHDSQPRLLAHLDQALSRVGLEGQLARDCLLAVVWAAASVAVLIPLLGPFAHNLDVYLTRTETNAVLLLVTVQSLALCLRRVRPLACLVVITVLQLALLAVLPDETTVRAGAVLVAAYTVGLLLPVRRVMAWVGGVALLEVVGGALVAYLVRPGVRRSLGVPTYESPPLSDRALAWWALNDIFVALLYLTAALSGVVVATRRDYLALLQARAAALLQEQDAHARRAVDGERARMARELHDIAAHHLSGLVVQAAAAERLIAGDPEAARQAARSVRLEGKQALSNLRLVVGVLRDRGPRDSGDRLLDGSAKDPEHAFGAPLPGLATIDILIASARRLGQEIELSTTGEAVALSPVADLTAYRVLQEALTNARQHAPGTAVRVLVDHTDHHVTVQVENLIDASGPSDQDRRGFGLLGMRERAALVDATLYAGPVAASRWRVSLAVPTRRPEPIS